MAMNNCFMQSSGPSQMETCTGISGDNIMANLLLLSKCFNSRQFYSVLSNNNIVSVRIIFISHSIEYRKIKTSFYHY